MTIEKSKDRQVSRQQSAKIEIKLSHDLNYLFDLLQSYKYNLVSEREFWQCTQFIQKMWKVYANGQLSGMAYYQKVCHNGEYYHTYDAYKDSSVFNPIRNSIVAGHMTLDKIKEDGINTIFTVHQTKDYISTQASKLLGFEFVANVNQWIVLKREN